jgi:hypothetical protein
MDLPAGDDDMSSSSSSSLALLRLLALLRPLFAADMLGRSGVLQDVSFFACWIVPNPRA